MESLLRWGIENSAPSDGSSAPTQPPRQISQLDPAIIDHILGKPDSVKMKEALEIATNENLEEDERVAALDDFEMLIESIDNANDITSMKLWGPLIKLLDSPSHGIRLNTLWIIGTAVQNNPKAQQAFLSLSPLPKVLSLLQPQEIDPAAQTRSKAVYCLSSLLKHNRSAVEQLESHDGWHILNSALSDSDITVRRKVAFMLNSLLLPDGSNPNQPVDTTTSDLSRDAIRKHAIDTTLVTRIVDPQPSGPNGEDVGADEDFEEKAARAILTYVQAGGKLRSEDSGRLLQSQSQSNATWGLAAEDLSELRKRLREEA